MFTLGNRYPNGDFWQNRGQPWGIPPSRTRRHAADRRQRHRDEEHAVAAVRREAVHRGIALGHELSYTYTDAEQNRDINEHYAFDQVSIKEYNRSSCRTPPRNIASSPPVRSGALGHHAGGQAHLVDADPAHGQLLPERRRRPSTTARRATAVHVHGRTTTGYQALDLQVTKNFEFGDIGSMYLRLDALNVTNAAQLRRLPGHNRPGSVS